MVSYSNENIVIIWNFKCRMIPKLWTNLERTNLIAVWISISKELKNLTKCFTKKMEINIPIVCNHQVGFRGVSKHVDYQKQCKMNLKIWSKFEGVQNLNWSFDQNMQAKISNFCKSFVRFLKICGRESLYYIEISWNPKIWSKFEGVQNLNWSFDQNMQTKISNFCKPFARFLKICGRESLYYIERSWKMNLKIWSTFERTQNLD